jgi:glycosyltransferase involved in cell wall biosynthesis
VIVPTRDRPQLVAAAVDSALNQTGSRLEVIVVDDGSASDAAAAVSDLARRDGRVRVVRMETSVGAAAARNRGIEEAQGELIGFLDDDDEWLPDTAGAAVAALADRPEIGAVSGWHDVVGDTGATVTYRGPVEYDAEDLMWCNFPAVPFAVMRRAALAGDLRFDESLVTCEDWDLFLRCARILPMATLPRVLYRYHQRRGPRVTASVERLVEGRTRFIRKHAGAMTPLCRQYHDARVEIMAAAGAGVRLRLAARLAGRLPARVSALITRESLSARVGMATSDPGRSARALLGMVRSLPARDRMLPSVDISS